MPLTIPDVLSAVFLQGKMRVTCAESNEDALPTGTISSPAAVSNNTAAPVTVGDLVTLTVTGALDAEDVSIPDSGAHWYSDLAGDLGPNLSRGWSAAVPGLHTLRCRLTDSDGGYTDLARLIQVNAPAGTPATVTDVRIWPYNPGLAVGATQQTTVAVIGTNNPSQAVNYASSNPAVATVSNTGLVTAVGVGRATITATSQVAGYTDKSGSTTVVVRAAGKAHSYETFAGLADNATTIPGWTDRLDASAGEFYISQGGTGPTSTGVAGTPGSTNSSRLRTAPSVAERRLKSWNVLDGKATGLIETRFASSETVAANGAAGIGFRMGGTPAAPTGYILYWYLDTSGNVQLRFVKMPGSSSSVTLKTTTLAGGVLVPNTTYELVLTVPASNLFSASVYAAADQLRASPLGTLTLDTPDADYASGWWGALGRSAAFQAWGDFRYTEL